MPAVMQLLMPAHRSHAAMRAWMPRLALAPNPDVLTIQMDIIGDANAASAAPPQQHASVDSDLDAATVLARHGPEPWPAELVASGRLAVHAPPLHIVVQLDGAAEDD